MEATYIRRRQEYELIGSQRRLQRLKSVEQNDAARLRLERVRTTRKQSKAAVRLKAPAIFSLIENPEETIAFLARIQGASVTRNISLDLQEVGHMTSDAIAAMLATIVEENGTAVRGNLPADTRAREMLLRSGFAEHVKNVEPSLSPPSGRIRERRSSKVEPETARDLIHHGSMSVWGEARKCQSAYRVLIECMNNTHNHAAIQGKRLEKWWASVYGDTERKRVCYTFLDTGVGIFRSVKLGAFRNVYKNLGLGDDSGVLKDILEAKIGSRTGIHYRGKGLPAIYEKSQNGSIRSLVIIANGVYANVEKSEYRMIRNPFKGTLLYWEVQS